MAYSAVLFDLDGTLLDTLEDLADSMNAVLGALGHPPHPLDAYRYFVGDGVRNLVARALPEAIQGDTDAVDRIVPLMREEYARRSTRKTRLYEGVAEMLDGLGARGIKLSILSNKPHPATQEVVGHYLSRWTFDAVLGQRPGVPIKPDAGAAREVCRLLSLPAGAFLYLGDTNTDMVTAHAAGMFAVGALWGFRTADELRAAGADALAKHPKDVVDLIG